MFRWAVHLNGAPDVRDQARVAVEHKVYYFAGSSFDVCIFNTVSLRWRQLPPVTTVRGERHHEVPSMSRGFTAVLIEDIIYIWGGFAARDHWDRDPCNVLYAFDVDTHRWLEPRVSRTVPEARGGHSACVLGKIMYIYGGMTRALGYANDIYTMDTTTMVWSLMNTRGTPPPASAWHSATIIGTRMFVFGGYGGAALHNYVRVFDTETNCWLSTPSARPLPGECHSTFAYNGELCILSDKELCKYIPETFSWKTFEAKGKRPYQMYWGCCMVGDRLIVFAGYKGVRTGWGGSKELVRLGRRRAPFDDLYILDLSPSLKTLCKLAVIQCGLEKSELPHDIRWELEAMTRVGGNSIKMNADAEVEVEMKCVKRK